MGKVAKPDIQVEIKVKLPVTLKKRAKWYLATCKPLDIHSQGETEAQAKKNLGEAISVFLFSCFQRGALDAALKECGFKLCQRDIKITRRTRPEMEFISVPLPFMIDRNRPGRCHELPQ